MTNTHHSGSAEIQLVRGGRRTPALLYRLITSSVLRAALGWDLPRRDVRWIDARPGNICIEIGSGGGFYTTALKSHLGTDSDLIALDPAAESLEPLATRLAKVPGATTSFVVGDGCRLPMADGYADILFYGYSLEEMPDPLAAIREAHRVLRPGGQLVVFLWRPVVTASRLRPILGLLDELFDADRRTMRLQNIRLSYRKLSGVPVD